MCLTSNPGLEFTFFFFFLNSIKTMTLCLNQILHLLKCKTMGTYETIYDFQD